MHTDKSRARTQNRKTSIPDWAQKRNWLAAFRHMTRAAWPVRVRELCAFYWISYICCIASCSRMQSKWRTTCKYTYTVLYSTAWIYTFAIARIYADTHYPMPASYVREYKCDVVVIVVTVCRRDMNNDGVAKEVDVTGVELINTMEHTYASLRYLQQTHTIICIGNMKKG